MRTKSPANQSKPVHGGHTNYYRLSIVSGYTRGQCKIHWGKLSPTGKDAHLSTTSGFGVEAHHLSWEMAGRQSHRSFAVRPQSREGLGLSYW